MIEKIKDTPNNTKTEDLVEFISANFPECLVSGEDGSKIDFDILKNRVLELKKPESYEFVWPGKQLAKLKVNEICNKTLTPITEDSLEFDGKEIKSTNFPVGQSENLYIEGENLQVLKLLDKTYNGGIKVIYIDPPYNVKGDFLYDDYTSDEEKKFVEISKNSRDSYHSKWLNMMYPRLRVARNLLTKDGVIFISIGDDEVANLKKLCDEIFFEDNFIGQWCWERTTTPPNLSKKIKKKLEYILAYQKGENNDRFTGIKKVSKSNDPITKPDSETKTLKFPKGSIITNLECKKYNEGKVAGTDKYVYKLESDLEIDEIEVNGEQKRTNKQEFSIASKFCWTQEKLNNEYKNGTIFSMSKKFVISIKKKEYAPEVPSNLICKEENVETTETAGKNLKEMFNAIEVYKYPKPVSLLKYLINFVIEDDEEAVVLDFFSGTGTTAHAVMELNAESYKENEDPGKKHFILVQLNTKEETCYEEGMSKLGQERIKKAANKIKKSDCEGVDLGYRMLQLQDSNLEIKQPESEFSYSVFKEPINEVGVLFEVMINLGISLSCKIEKQEVDKIHYYSVDNGKLIAYFGDDQERKITSENIKSILKKEKETDYLFIIDDRIKTDAEKCSIVKYLDSENKNVKCITF